MVFIHAPVGQNQNIGSVAVCPVAVDEQTVQRVLQGHAGVIQQRDGFYAETGVVHIANFHQVHGGQNGVADLQHRAVFRPLLKQIPARAHVDRGVGDDLLPDGVHGRVRHLSEKLLEIVEQGLMLFTEHRQRRIHAHGGGGLGPVPGHGEQGVLDLLVGIAEGLVQPVPQLLGVGLHLPVGDGQVLEVDQMPVQPFAVGLAVGIALLDLPVVHQPSQRQVRQQHPPRLKPGFFHDPFRRDVQYAHLGGEDQGVVVGEIPAAGPKAVSVQYGAHRVPV